MIADDSYAGSATFLRVKKAIKDVFGTDNLSQIKYCADRVKWLWDNRKLIGGLEWVEEPAVLRFFFGRMKEIGYWQEELAEKFRKDFGDSL